MKAYTRAEFLKLPAMTIYSRINEEHGELMYGLFCKTSDQSDMESDWVEQNLISEPGFPNGISDGMDAIEYQLTLRDEGKDFETDLECAGRDGMFEDKDRFVVWDKKDITKLRDYLNNCLSA